MGNKRKQARRAARQALKSKSRILGYEIDTIIVDEVASAAPALPPKPKRDTSPIEARNEAQAHYLISLDTKPDPDMRWRGGFRLTAPGLRLRNIC